MARSWIYELLARYRDEGEAAFAPLPPPAHHTERDRARRRATGPDPAQTAGPHQPRQQTGTVTLRHAGRLHHIGLGRSYAGTHVLILAEDLSIQIIDAATGEILRDLVLDPTKDY